MLLSCLAQGLEGRLLNAFWMTKRPPERYAQLRQPSQYYKIDCGEPSVRTCQAGMHVNGSAVDITPTDSKAD